MKKELIIIVYKINTSGYSRANVEDQIKNLAEYGLSNDKELKENYIIRDLFLPISDGNNDIQIIYPIINNTITEEASKSIEEINLMIKEDESLDCIKNTWNKLLRQLKLKILNNE